MWRVSAFGAASSTNIALSAIVLHAEPLCNNNFALLNCYILIKLLAHKRQPIVLFDVLPSSVCVCVLFFNFHSFR